MSLYLLFAPFSPIILLLNARKLVASQHIISFFFAFCAFIPAAVLSTFVHNQFTIYHVSFETHVIRFLFSDYLIQLCFLMLVLIVFINAQAYTSTTTDVASAILVFCCGYFFCEALYRLLFIPVTRDAYELFAFPTIRLFIIAAAHLLSTHFHSGKKCIILVLCTILVACFAAALSALMWFNFIAISLVILIACAIIAIWYLIHLSNAV